MLTCCSIVSIGVGVGTHHTTPHTDERRIGAPAGIKAEKYNKQAWSATSQFFLVHAHAAMIYTGAQIIAGRLVQGVRHIAQQQQPCGIDLTLRKVSRWTSTATLDFDNTKRKAATLHELPFDDESQSITLQPGAYLVDFNETVTVPLDCVATIFPRSSLWRSGVSITSGIIDAGYQGVLGALLEVKNPHGVVLYQSSKLSQIIFEQMTVTVPGYNGVYQNSKSSAGIDGSGDDHRD